MFLSLIAPHTDYNRELYCWSTYQGESLGKAGQYLDNFRVGFDIQGRRDGVKSKFGRKDKDEEGCGWVCLGCGRKEGFSNFILIW